MVKAMYSMSKAINYNYYFSKYCFTLMSSLSPAAHEKLPTVLINFAQNLQWQTESHCV